MSMWAWPHHMARTVALGFSVYPTLNFRYYYYSKAILTTKGV